MTGVEDISHIAHTHTVQNQRLREIDDLNREWLACPHCDELWQRPRLNPGQRARCGRCHSVILTNKRRSTENTMALMTASLILNIVAVTFPFLKMEKSGLSNEISVLDAISVLWVNGLPGLAIGCAAFVLVFPLARIILLLHLGMSVQKQQDTGRKHAYMFRLAQILEPWTMAEIFMIGVIVSLVKVGKLADLSIGPAFWAMFSLMILLSLGALAVCRDTFWQDIRRAS